MTIRKLVVVFFTLFAVATFAVSAGAAHHEKGEENPCGESDNPCGENPCGDNPCGDNPCGDEDSD
ncbi:MAG: hypothetical protein ACQGVC_03705 [Myxococcota bacterium]